MKLNDGQVIGQRFPALYVRDYRLFFIGQTISLVGTWMQQTALGWLVYSITKSSFYLGLLGMALSLPVLFFSLFGGVFADRFNKRNLLIATQASSIIPAIVLALLTGFHCLNVWAILCVAAFLGTVNSLDIPVRQSYMIEISGRENLLNAVALNSTSFHGARVLGPSIAGMIISLYGMSACFYINAVSFIPVIYLLFRISNRGKPKGGAYEGVFTGIKGGIDFILGHRRILFIIITISIFSLFGIPYAQFMPIFADKVYGVGAIGLGYMMSSVGAGSVLAGVIIAFRRDIKNKLLFMSVTGFLFPVSLLAFTIINNYHLALVFLSLVGFNLVGFLATANSYIQLEVPDEFRGRVMSVYAAMFLGTVPFGAVLAGTLGQTIGIRPTILSTAAACLAGFTVFQKKWK
ncbi:MAG: MFS transporter [Candidatus Magnetominusculus sp. LBB02]|nr:MFS transporter [Candidatus Magnetominusculus sp. LBB02]